MAGKVNLKSLELALTHATMWFQVHAEQRMKLMSFYVILLAGVIAGFAAALKDKNQLLEFLIAIAIVILTYAFKSLDQRTSSLVKNAEAALEKVEETLANETSFDQLKLIKLAENRGGNFSYRQSFNFIFGLGYFLAFLGFVLSVWPFIENPS
ncbi:MAG: hypothetical protein HQ513_14625 [Rhodospirillales bacterium]|nr:hypothetical protein [Rhodospirillales bacterium]